MIDILDGVYALGGSVWAMDDGEGDLLPGVPEGGGLMPLVHNGPGGRVNSGADPVPEWD